MRDVLLLFGMQGSGKGTQAERIIEKYGFVSVSAGPLLREKAKTDPRIGEAQNKGVLVPDEIVEATIEEKVDSLGENQKILFDGFPRSGAQLEMYKRISKRHDLQSLAILIQISEEEAIKRISTRYTCPECEAIGFKPGKCTKCKVDMIKREDDTEEAVRQRIEIFKRDTAPLIDYFKEKGEYAEVNGIGTFDKVTERIFQKIDDYYKER